MPPEGFTPRIITGGLDNKEEETEFQNELHHHGVDIPESGEFYPVPDLKDLKDELTPEAKKSLERLSTVVAGFLSFPIVTDTITDHAVRRTWRAEMVEKYGSKASFLTDNRMRLNKVTGVMGFTEMALNKIRAIPNPSESIQDIEHLLTDILATSVSQTEYNALSVEGKKEKIQAISVAVRSFLDYVTTFEAEEEYKEAA